jgi:tetratricopeptide (TPR) repeat protein
VILVLLAYLPAFSNGYIWDDDDYVYRSPVIRTLEGLGRTWSKPGVTTQYYPLVHTSFWLEHKLWRFDPAGYHATNVLLHALGAILLLALLGRLRVPGAWLAAALFAVHPVHVESVGWITERKNVLSLVFYLGSMLAACRFLGLEGDDEDRPRRLWRWYGLSFALFMLALLSKTVTATMPAALVVVLWWKRPRFGRREITEVALLLPFLAMGTALGSLTSWLERHVVGASGPAWATSTVDRALVAGRALWFYLGKLVVPYPLAFFYRRWTVDAGQAAQYIWPLGFVLLLGALWLLRRRVGKGPLAALLLFAGTLSPAIGFFDVFFQQYSIVADHFQYAASIPVLALLAAAFVLACGRLGVAQLPLGGASIPMRAAVLRVGVPTAALLALVALSVRRNLAFENLLTLWQDTVATTPSSWIAHNNLGEVLLDLGRVDEAAWHLQQAVDTAPMLALPRTNLGRVRARQGRIVEAEQELRAAYALEPSSYGTLMGMASFLAGQRRYPDALAFYRRAAEDRPWAADPLVGAGLVLSDMGQQDSAVRFFQRALAIEPDNPRARLGLTPATADLHGSLTRTPTPK